MRIQPMAFRILWLLWGTPRRYKGRNHLRYVQTFCISVESKQLSEDNYKVTGSYGATDYEEIPFLFRGAPTPKNGVFGGRWCLVFNLRER